MASIARLRIGYWSVTAVLAVAFLIGGVVDLAASTGVVAFMRHLGYPPYFARLLGAWKVAGGITLLAPRLARLKEWAYAGIVFDLTSAVVAHAMVGDAFPSVALPLAMLAMTVLSWALRPASRRLAADGAEGRR